MKKIALITDGWRRYITYSWVDGIIGYAKEIGLDIKLFTYNTNGNLSHDPKYNIGEYSLYELPDLSRFDGIIFDGTNTIDMQQLKHTVDRLKELDVPVVSISYYIEGFHYVGNDNKALFRKVIDHLINVHGCRRLVFAGGPQSNYENMVRYEAFVEANEAIGVKVSEDMCLYGDFDFDTGKRYLHEWIKEGRKLPDAFVCANDNIAAGICYAAEGYGLKIPKDFRVTGFDNLDKAAYYKPQITTVEHNRGNIGKRSLQILVDIWSGKKTDAFTYLQSEMITGESCGCPNSGRVDYRDYAKWQIDWAVDKERYDETLLELDSKIAERTDFESLLECFAHYIESLDCSGVYLIIDRNIPAARHDHIFPTGHYDTDELIVAYASENGNRIYSINSHEELTEHLNGEKSLNSFVFFPIHFRDESVGYAVLGNPVFLYNNPFFHDVLASFVDKLQALYRQLQISNIADELRDIYNRDPLTHLYNRHAYNEMIPAAFERYCANGIPCAISFFDIDYFKSINDTYGHDFGDRVLTAAASILSECSPKDGFAYRFGGDEFVVFFPYAYSEKIDRFTERVMHKFRENNIEVSNGIIVTDPGSGMTPDDYLIMADKKMYEVKSSRHRESEAVNGLHKVEKPLTDKTGEKSRNFLKGVDISSLIQKLDNNELFYNEEGQETEVFELLRQNNINAVRVRIWNNPENEPESKGYCNLEDTLKMAAMVRDAGMDFMLDFHYSDYWADPGQQRKPGAWENLSYEELKTALHDYTYAVLSRLAEIDALPDIVQVGNEIRSGMLFPDGAVPDYKRLAGLVNAGISAVREVSPKIKVMIHLDQGGRYYYLKEWFDAMFAAGLDSIDAIGISFYSFWHGTFMDLRSTMKNLIERYKKPVYVVETAHPWRQCEGEHVSKELMETAGLPAGISEQKTSLSLVQQIACEVSGQNDTGVYYWEPLGITNSEYGSWDQNMGMLDDDHRVLPGFEAFRDFDPENPPFANLNEYIESLYATNDDKEEWGGENLIANHDFAQGLSGWKVEKSSDEVEVEERENEIYVSADCNFRFELSRTVRIDEAGDYRLAVDYRGTNTTGVRISLFLQELAEGGRTENVDIFPSDVRFVTHSTGETALKNGEVRVGIRMETPPVFGRIANFRLVRV